MNEVVTPGRTTSITSSIVFACLTSSYRTRHAGIGSWFAASDSPSFAPQASHWYQRSISFSRDQTLKVWNVETGAHLRTLAGHSDSVNGVALSGDGRCAVSASDDNTLKVWDVETGAELLTLAGHSDKVNHVSLSADGRRAVSASRDKTLKVWDLETGGIIAAFTCDAATSCCATAGTRTVLAGDDAGHLHLLSLELAV
jgi:WD40 repeat protein